MRHEVRRWRLLTALLLLVSSVATAQQRAAASAREIEAALAHPLFDGYYTCSEHAAGELPYLGDDLGQDCVPLSFGDKGAPAFLSLHKGDGLRNEDWYGWNREVSAPAGGTVVRVTENPVVNVPGRTGKPPASIIIIETEDGTRFLLAHIQCPAVKAGDSVEAGEVIATVGNNGVSRMPHIHIGAWRGDEALQIRWDQRKMRH